jgi:putative glutamine amidotransferase
MIRPCIGITSWHRRDGDQLERWEAIRDNYTGAVLAAGGLPVILPIADTALAPAYLARLDGILFTGGEDVAPAHYGEPTDARCQAPDAERDGFELALARAGWQRGTPMLGICRGLQLLNVAGGGSLYQDLACRPGTRGYHAADGAARQHLVHEVRILPETRLASLLGCEHARVTSTHHQFVKALAPGFRVAAESPEDGIVEGIEAPGRPFVVAVQWHPERMYDRDQGQLALFRGLVEAARDPRHAA